MYISRSSLYYHMAFLLDYGMIANMMCLVFNMFPILRGLPLVCIPFSKPFLHILHHFAAQSFVFLHLLNILTYFPYIDWV